MSQMSRKCVPFTPYERELARATVAIVTAAGVHQKDQEPFNIADELGRPFVSNHRRGRDC